MKFTHSALALLIASTAAAGDAALAKAIADAGLPGGTAAFVGVRDAEAMAALTARGTWLAQALVADGAAADALRGELAGTGAFPLADAQWTPDARVLPYPDRLCMLVVADDGAAPAAELDRITAFGGMRLIRSGGAWKAERKPFSPQADEWTHAFHSAAKLPVSGDLLVGPATGVAWIGGHSSVLNISLRIDDGRVFAIHDQPERKVPGWVRGQVLQARDAASGVLLWQRPLKFNAPEYAGAYRETGNWFTAHGGRVYLFTENDGPLVALDGATGKELLRFAEAGRLKPGTPSGKSKVAIPEGLSHAAVLARDDGLILGMDDAVWRLDPATGAVRWKAEPKDGARINSALWIGDDVIWLESVGGTTRSLVCAAAADGKPRWRNDTVDTGPGGLIIGPDDAYIPVQFGRGSFKGPSEKGDDVGTWQGKASAIQLYRRKDGSAVWKKGSIHPARFSGWMWQGKYWMQGASDRLTAYEPESYKRGDSTRWLPKGVGCPVCVFTPKWLVRGIQLTPFSDLDRVLGTQGFRTGCESPTLPAYGRLHVTNSECGCGWFIGGGIITAWPAPAVQPVADAQRRRSDGAVRLTQAPKTPSGPAWDDGFSGIDVSQRRPGKGTAKMDPAEVKKITSDLPDGWYAGAETAPVEANGVSVVSVIHAQRLEGRRGAAVAWSLLLGGRVTTAPLLLNGTLYAGATDGWVYAIDPATGGLKWRHQVAPAARQHVVFGRVESAWPIIGVAAHQGRIVAVAGRANTMDDGLWFAGLSADGARAFAFRAIQHVADMKGSVSSKANKDEVPYANLRGLVVNAPPRVIGDDLYLMGSLRFDLKNPKDVVVNADVRYDPAKLP